MKRKSPDLSWLQPKGHVGEAKRRLAKDAAERKTAEKSPSSIILGKGDVQGEYDTHRVLTTTLGGVRRVITANDLAAFRKNMRTVQSRLTGTGITSRQVLELAHDKPLKGVDGGSDLTRADQQIRVALPVSASVKPSSPSKVLDLRFITNAGPDSRVTRHNVLVRFLGFGEAARALQTAPTTSETKERAISPKQAAQRLRAGYLAYECDCERHRFFFRFIATIGGFNAGRDEHGYPKVTNPGLKGVACKHVLRVMAEVNSSAGVLRILTDTMSRVQRSQDNLATIQINQQQAREQAAKQVKRPRNLPALAEALKRKPPAKIRPATRRSTKLLKEGKIDELLRAVPFLSAQDRARLQAALTKGN